MIYGDVRKVFSRWGGCSLDSGAGTYSEKGVVNLRSSLTLLLEQVSYELALSDVPKMGALFKKH